jgi:hypothetical protein
VGTSFTAVYLVLTTLLRRVGPQTVLKFMLVGAMGPSMCGMFDSWDALGSPTHLDC